MKATGVIRPIDDLGRVVLPIELRKVMNINSKDLLEIFVDGPQIILKKYHKSCIFCGETEDLIDFKDQCICENCQKELGQPKNLSALKNQYTCKNCQKEIEKSN